jgi:hypothetical protein
MSGYRFAARDRLARDESRMFYSAVLDEVELAVEHGDVLDRDAYRGMVDRAVGRIIRTRPEAAS